MTDCLAFAERLCARLAHDLGGALGTVSGAVELLGHEDAAIREEAQALALEGASQLRRRLSYLRAAWGPDGEEFSVASAAAMAAGVLGGGRVRLDIARVAEPERPLGPLGRVLLNALVVAAEALPRGGTVLCAGGPGELVLQPSGEGAAWPAGLAALLGGEDPIAAAVAGGPRAIAAPMLVALARREGVSLALLMGGGIPLLALRSPRQG